MSTLDELKQENERLRAEVERYKTMSDNYCALNMDAQSELTKARGLATNLESVLLEVRGCLERPDVRQPGWEDRCLDRMYAVLPVAHQPAPAAKGGSDE